MAPNFDIESLVVKYIPLELRKDDLEEHFRLSGCPQAWSFAYNFEHGQFYGTAFVNYYSPEDATRVIELMNNFEIGDSHLDIRYKAIPYAKMRGEGNSDRETLYARYKQRQVNMRDLATRQNTPESDADSESPSSPASHPVPPTPTGSPDLATAVLDQSIQDLDETTSVTYEAQQIKEIGAVEDAEESESNYWLPTSLLEAMSE